MEKKNWGGKKIIRQISDNCDRFWGKAEKNIRGRIFFRGKKMAQVCKRSREINGKEKDFFS